MQDTNTSPMRAMFGWGFALWLFGYLLGFLFYPLVPVAMIGWCVTPFGLAAVCFVLWKWIRAGSLRDGLMVGAVWCAIAIVCDHVFIVKLLDPPDGYYKLDVYIYYAVTLALPVIVARLRSAAPKTT